MNFPQKTYARRSYRRLAIIVGSALTAFGLILFYFGWKFYQEARYLEENGIVTQGVVIDIRKNGIYRSPYVKFKTRNGDEIVFVSELEVAENFYKYPVGTKVEVIYVPDNPYNASINAEMEKKFLHYFLFGLGSLLFLVAIFVYSYYSKKAKKLV